MKPIFLLIVLFFLSCVNAVKNDVRYDTEGDSYNEGVIRVYFYIEKVLSAEEKKHLEDKDIYVFENKTIKKKVGYIDKKGRLIINPKYDYGGPFSEGLAVVAINEKYGYIDRRGNEIIEKKYEDAMSFSEGIAPIKKNGKWGFINRFDELIIDCEYDSAFPFSEGYSLVKKNGKYGFIDNKGIERIKLIYNEICSSFSEGFAVVKNLNKRCVFINAHGDKCITGEFDMAFSFNEGVAPVCINKKWGFIDCDGNYLIEPKFDFLSSYQEGISIVGKENGSDIFYGYINREGEYIIEPKYKFAESFSEGIANVVTKDGKRLFINRNGDIILNFSKLEIPLAFFKK